MKKNRLALALMATAFVTACSSNMKKAQIDPAANPSTEISRLETAVKEGQAQHLDVLAHKEFSKAEKHLAEAKEDLAENKKQQDILDEVAYGDAYLAKAQEVAAERRPQAEALMDARQKALSSGARNYGPTEKTLKKIDDDVRDEAKNLGKLKAEDMAKLQERYLNLELDAVIASQLGDAHARIEGAKDKKAKRNAPNALKQAEMDYKTAENKIRANRNMTEGYADSVAAANRSALMLSAVLTATKEGKVDEGTATQLVAKDQQLLAREQEISSLNSNLSAFETAQGQLQKQMANQNARLEAANAAVNMQKSIEMARSQFSKDEAEVFQQGNKLLIRLKAVNFPSGSANLPEKSLDILGKVRDVAASLNPSEVVIEGHTDSVGKKDLNDKLSQERAQSVAKYMETNGLESANIQAVGFGFEKPIASNKTKAGREQNRRVDVIVTPATAATESSTKSR